MAEDKSKDVISEKLDKLIDIEKKILDQRSKGEKPQKQEAPKKKSDSEKLKEEVDTQVGATDDSVDYRDIAKASIGAVVGSLMHFLLIYGAVAAENISVLKASIIMPISLLVAVVFLYFTSLKQANRPTMKAVVIKGTLIYITALLVSVAVLYILYPAKGATFESAYNQVAAASLLSVIGACIADLFSRQ